MDKNLQNNATEETGWFPATPFQEGLFAFWRRNPDSVSYNMPQFFRLRGDLDVDRLKKSIDRLIETEEVFRLRLHWRDDAVFQSPVDALPTGVEIVDCEVADVNELHRRLVKPFNLETGPLIRSTILKLPNRDHILFLDYHHAIADGGCAEFVLRAISARYRGESVGSSESAFRRFCWELSGQEASAARRANEAFWQQRLEGVADEWKIPADFEVSSEYSGHSAFAATSVEEDLLAEMKQFAQRHSVTSGSLIQAAVAITMSNFAASRKCLFSVPVRLPEAHQIGPVPGVFINSMLFPIEIDEASSTVDFVQQISAEFFECYDHANFPYHRALRLLAKQEKRREEFLEPCFFSYLMRASVELSLEGVEIEVLKWNFGNPKSALTWMVWETESDLTISLEYAKARYREPTIEALLAGVRTVLERLCRQGGPTVGDLRPDSKTSWTPSIDPNKEIDVALESFAPSLPMDEAAASQVDGEVQDRPMVSTNPAWKQDEIEHVVREEWSKLLRREDIEVDENFFDAGGDSLLLIRLEAQLLQLFPDLERKVDLFQYPTIADQTAFIRSSRTPEADSAPASTESKQQQRLERRRS